MVGDSVKEVISTLEEAVIIVIIVIFLFLLDWRATIIPAVTIPISLIGTFAFINAFHFSINSLTLFGITLATGLVVDDAIVVIENAQRHINLDNTDPHNVLRMGDKRQRKAGYQFQAKDVSQPVGSKADVAFAPPLERDRKRARESLSDI